MSMRSLQVLQEFEKEVGLYKARLLILASSSQTAPTVSLDIRYENLKLVSFDKAPATMIGELSDLIGELAAFVSSTLAVDLSLNAIKYTGSTTSAPVSPPVETPPSVEAEVEVSSET